ncbi:Crp/Fnr family transcriptional regulator [Poseidonocella sp. HB161398]|uniref:Crp/Fnr family transcriptional regulator n=1 Tax=Poseidonocella sp. HB161398 TaxID=2320855 RepID=UPI0011091B84|nr:Crp/Fnr family transcriptional regulator [Poseidonocella sp. HB161398]
MSNNIFAQRCRGKSCQNCSARTNGFCGALDAEALAEFSGQCFCAGYERDAEIVRQGEPSGKVGVIAKGLVKIVMFTEDGEEHMLQILRQSQLVGMPCSMQSSFAWEAATRAEICWMPRSTWDDFLRAHPEHFEAYVKTMLHQMEELQCAVANSRGRNTRQRVAHWLLEQVPEDAAPDRPIVDIPLKRRDLAALLDMTAETLCRSLHALAGKGAIDILMPYQIEITDLAKLRTLAKSPHNDKFVPLSAETPLLATEAPRQRQARYS